MADCENTGEAAISSPYPLKTKKASRTGHRSSTTKFINQVDPAIEAMNTPKLKQLKKSLADKASVLAKLDEEILSYSEESEIEAEIEQADSIQERISLAIIKLEEVLEAITAITTSRMGNWRTPPPPPSPFTYEDSSDSDESLRQIATRSHARKSDATTGMSTPSTVTSSQPPLASVGTDVPPTTVVSPLRVDAEHAPSPLVTTRPRVTFSVASTLPSAVTPPLISDTSPSSTIFPLPGLTMATSKILSPLVYTSTVASPVVSISTDSGPSPGMTSHFTNTTPGFIHPTLPPRHTERHSLSPWLTDLHPSLFPPTEPHSSPFRPADPHSSSLRPTDPHSSPFRPTDPHSSSLRPTDPHSSPFRPTDPHPSSFRHTDFHSTPHRPTEPWSYSSWPTPPHPVPSWSLDPDPVPSTSTVRRPMPPGLSSTHHQIKLPRLTLKRFNGNITNWIAFWDSFDSAIHIVIQLYPMSISLRTCTRCWTRQPLKQYQG